MVHRSTEKNGWWRENYPPVIVGLIVLVMLLLVAIINARAETRKIYKPGDRVTCLGPLTRDRLKAMAVEVLDDAFKSHMMDLFKTMMRDPTDQPRRLQDGTNKAIFAYLGVKDLLAAFNPPACEGEYRPEERR